MPGLMVSGGALPGEAKSFNIRGTVSINGMNPLVLIDNVEGDIDLLNPEDIESVTVLKDAASSAIYGARAAAGVILITTKKAKKGEKFNLNYNANFGFQTSINSPKQASLDEYLKSLPGCRFLFWPLLCRKRIRDKSGANTWPGIRKILLRSPDRG